MKPVRIGIITIGQSPRSDVIPDFLTTLGFLPSIEQLGLLDGLSCAEISSLSPRSSDEKTLVTRLQNGTEVKISEKYIVERLPKAISMIEARGVDLIVLFCTGELPPVHSNIPILYPSAIIYAVVSSILLSCSKKPRLCIIAPAGEQFPMLTRKWEGTGCFLLFEALSPYTSKDSEILSCARKVAQLHCDMIVLDCIGFTAKIKQVFLKTTGKPVILPRSLVARVAAEISTEL